MTAHVAATVEFSTAKEIQGQKSAGKGHGHVYWEIRYFDELLSSERPNVKYFAVLIKGSIQIKMAKVAVKTFKVLLSAYRDSNIMEFFWIFLIYYFFFKEFWVSVHKTSALLSKSCSIYFSIPNFKRSLKREEILGGNWCICRIVIQHQFFFWGGGLGGDRKNLKNNPQSVLNCRQIHGICILTH